VHKRFPRFATRGPSIDLGRLRASRGPELARPGHVDRGVGPMSESSRGAHPRLTIRHVLADAYRAILALDSPLLRVIRDLTLRPGQFVRRYVEGERTGVVGPIKYALLSLTASVIAGQLGREPVSPDLSPEDLAWRQALEAAHDLRAYIALLVLIPTAMVQRTLFWRRPFNLAETYVFLAYVMGHWFWLWTLEVLLPN